MVSSDDGCPDCLDHKPPTLPGSVRVGRCAALNQLSELVLDQPMRTVAQAHIYALSLVTARQLEESAMKATSRNEFVELTGGI